MTKKSMQIREAVKEFIATCPGPLILPVTEVGWRVRLTGHFEVAFDITIDDGETWTTTHSWHRPTAGDIVRAGYAAAAQHPWGARLVEFEEVNGTWIPRIEQEEEEE